MQSPVSSVSSQTSQTVERDSCAALSAVGEDGVRVLSLDTTDTSIYSAVRGEINAKVYNIFMNALDSCTPEEDLIIDIHSSGGDMFYTTLIANAVAEHRGKTVARVSRVAMSGATVIVLACDEIIMAPTACLGPIDLQMLLPVKCALPALEQYKDKNALCGILHTVFDNYTNDYLVKVQDILTELYSEQEMEHLLDFFYYTYEHQTPLFPRNIMEGLPFLKLVVDPDLKYSPCPQPKEAPDMISAVLGL